VISRILRRAKSEYVAVAGCALMLSAAALYWCVSHGYTLYYGDAEAHLNIARRIVDSRTPGFDQFGTNWLPLPHVLMLPFVWNDGWWRSGLAGGLPSACAFVVACVLLYAAARRAFLWPAAAIAAVAVFALNPNVLYLQAIPMTESAFFASLIGLLFTTIWFRQTGSVLAVLGAGIFSNAASLTRYEGWFLIPFATVFFFVAGGRRRWWAGFLFGAIASLTPLFWLAYNWWYYRNPLEFYNGPYSTKGIYERALKAGGDRQPGDHDWLTAVEYFWAAVSLTAGAPLAWLGVLGSAAALWRRKWWPVILLALTPVFYVWSLHSSGAQIFVPALWPKSYYNTRYGTTMLPLLALGAAALVAVTPRRFRNYAAVAMVAVAVTPWVIHPQRDSWACWKESQLNSEARRAWTTAGGRFLGANYKSGGVFTSFGDLTGIFRSAGIPLRDTLHEGNNPEWMVAQRKPVFFLKEEWAVAFSGDAVATAIQRANRERPLYALVELVTVPHADVVEIYRRTGGDGALPRLCAQHLVENCESGPSGDRALPSRDRVLPSRDREEADSGEEHENTVHQGARR
jgi:4-amino-4-deoxy-L-arabinose transferase-like glycosyltransferase